MITLTVSWLTYFGGCTPSLHLPFNSQIDGSQLLLPLESATGELGWACQIAVLVGRAFTAASHSHKGQGPHSPGRRPARRACSVVSNRWKRLTLWESCPLAYQGSWHRRHGLLSSASSQAAVLDLLGTSQGTLWNNIFLSLSLFGNSLELIQPNELEKCS